MTSEERLIKLETKLSYQESVVADLNEIVVAQQKEIDRLTKSLERLTVRLTELREQASGAMPHIRPPHY